MYYGRSSRLKMLFVSSLWICMCVDIFFGESAIESAIGRATAIMCKSDEITVGTYHSGARVPGFILRMIIPLISFFSQVLSNANCRGILHGSFIGNERKVAKEGALWAWAESLDEYSPLHLPSKSTIVPFGQGPLLTFSHFLAFTLPPKRHSTSFCISSSLLKKKNSGFPAEEQRRK
ncbi:hypothetical protein BC939DRAFT_334782 [Gamsiella multidivaricata]|uniref:uncharacterized protein n=1 Tax=Gamsiella multidivaricata TaxID=101098 RepID=UPI00221FA196|nr:uncharacterized protein BC939DRAFT_334782 [Gamsiella multidivaricata]KAI7817285.1 hypothetical protein BC939DRAFT_334782 [Gamsiella multidivaricata]